MHRTSTGGARIVAVAMQAVVAGGRVVGSHTGAIVARRSRTRVVIVTLNVARAAVGYGRVGALVVRVAIVRRTGMAIVALTIVRAAIGDKGRDAFAGVARLNGARVAVVGTPGSIGIRRGAIPSDIVAGLGTIPVPVGTIAGTRTRNTGARKVARVADSALQTIAAERAGRIRTGAVVGVFVARFGAVQVRVADIVRTGVTGMHRASTAAA